MRTRSARPACRRRGAALLVGALAVTGGLGAALYREAPPPAHTGGFGEPTCAHCHLDVPLNDPEGALRIDAPVVYRPGQRVEVRIVLRRPGMQRAGFELAARTPDGRAAGRWEVPPGLGITEVGGVPYVHHTRASTDVVRGDSAVWTLVWTAPTQPTEVRFHVAANAANGDDSDTGDAPYAAAAVARPAAPLRARAP